MSRLFRKITSLLTEGPGLRRYFFYALGEIILVVLGILIALQINTWNQHRENKQELQNMLVAFKNENELNRQSLDLSIKDIRHVRSALRGLLENMGDRAQDANPRTVDSLLFEGLSITLFDPNKAAYLNLISSGRMRYIQDDTLELKLLEWDSRLDHLRNAELILFQGFKNIVLPHFYDKISLVKLDRQFAKGYDELPPSAFEFDNRMALTRMETENILEDHFYNLERIQKLYESFYVDFGNFNQQIDRELEE